jgi:hypothetical protein
MDFMGSESCLWQRPSSFHRNIVNVLHFLLRPQYDVVLEEVSNSRQETTAFFFKIQTEKKRNGWGM